MESKKFISIFEEYYQRTDQFYFVGRLINLSMAPMYLLLPVAIDGFGR